jgi:putative transposase
MPRANRHYMPGYVWHITHRCHQKEFLLRYPDDRACYIHWLCEARNRYGVSVLNYVVTSNHVHLLILDVKEGVISRSMQLVAGRTGQEYNRREQRRGAFWEDRYHATIVQTNRHLLSCMIYIDLNMVRAGVVRHPGEWSDSGYSELQNEQTSISVIDRVARKSLLGFDDVLNESYQKSLYDRMESHPLGRELLWTESIAVGDEAYIIETKKRLSYMGKGRMVLPSSGAYMLRETLHAYDADDPQAMGNTYEWDLSDDKSDS